MHTVETVNKSTLCIDIKVCMYIRKKYKENRGINPLNLSCNINENFLYKL